MRFTMVRRANGYTTISLGNLMPCCFEPKQAVVSVYGNIDDAGDHFNSEHCKFSREYFANQQGFRESEIGFSREADGKNFLATLCISRPAKNSLPNVNVHQLPAYFSYADTCAIIHREAVTRLVSWDEESIKVSWPT